ncbi:uncharacterized protein ACIBXB_018442 isoform 6-T7 [Morphnus guianensis]
MSQVSVAQGLLHSAETLHRDRVAGAIPEGSSECCYLICPCTGGRASPAQENPPSATWPLFCLPGSFAVTCDTAGNVARTWGGDTSDNVLSAPVPPADPSLDRLTSSHTHIQPLTSAVSQKQRRKTLVGCDSPFIVNSRRHTRTAIDGAREPRPAQCKPTRAQ